MTANDNGERSASDVTEPLPSAADAAHEVGEPKPVEAEVVADESQRKGRAVLRREAVVASRFEGPLPPPGLLAQYNSAFPGCAERIVRMAEQQSEHRQAIEKAVIQANIKNEARGQYIAGALSLVALLGGLSLVGMDKEIQGFAVLVLNLGALVTAFVLGKRTQGRSLDRTAEKARELDKGQASPAAPTEAPDKP